MTRSKFFSVFVAFFLAAPAFAADLPADGCQIYIRRLQAAPSSHGSAALRAFVKVNWLGNGEMIQKVGFYGTNSDQDLGNATGSCSWGMRPTGNWYIQDPAPSNGPATALGEYLFNFQIASGSIGGPCNGFAYSTSGTFFVQTNKNTYWLNPELDSTKYFYFDGNGFDSITRKGGTYHDIFTDTADMRYYNPKGCAR